MSAPGEIIWIGSAAASMHPRAVILDADVSLRCGERSQVGALLPWQPPALSGRRNPYHAARGFARDSHESQRQRWQELAARLGDIAAARNHVIGAALLRDLAAGQSFAALHRRTALLAAADHDGAIDAARELVAIGSESGWDMLTGFVIAATGEVDHAGRARLG